MGILGDFDLNKEYEPFLKEHGLNRPDKSVGNERDYLGVGVGTSFPKQYESLGYRDLPWQIAHRSSPDHLGLGNKFNLTAMYGPHEGFFNSGVGPGRVRWDGLPLGSGAGSTANDHIVPDRIGNVDLFLAANNHDEAYADGMDKDVADSKFKEAIFDSFRLNGCGEVFSRVASFVFWLGVHLGGGGAYEKARKKRGSAGVSPYP